MKLVVIAKIQQEVLHASWNVHQVMKLVVIAKILQEMLRASWNFSSAHLLHDPMNVKKSNFNS